MRILVCGGRKYNDMGRVNKELNYLRNARGCDVIIHGAAAGADSMAGQWAEANGIPVERHPADWERHGRAAGPIRNQEMLVNGKPDLVVAFPGGVGTADMVKRAKKAGVEVYEVI